MHGPAKYGLRRESEPRTTSQLVPSKLFSLVVPVTVAVEPETVA